MTQPNLTLNRNLLEQLVSYDDSVRLKAEQEVRALLATPVIDIGQGSWEAIQQAAGESAWMPKEYMQNEWVSDVCAFLRDPRPNEDQARSDNQFYTAQLQLRACKALGLDPDSCSWFDVVGKLEEGQTFSDERLNALIIAYGTNLQYCNMKEEGFALKAMRDALAVAEKTP